MDTNMPMPPVRRLLEELTGAVARGVTSILPVTQFIFSFLEEDRAAEADEATAHIVTR